MQNKILMLACAALLAGTAAAGAQTTAPSPVDPGTRSLKDNPPGDTVQKRGQREEMGTDSLSKDPPVTSGQGGRAAAPTGPGTDNPLGKKFQDRGVREDNQNRAIR